MVLKWGKKAIYTVRSVAVGIFLFFLLLSSILPSEKDRQKKEEVARIRNSIIQGEDIVSDKITAEKKRNKKLSQEFHKIQSHKENEGNTVSSKIRNLQKEISQSEKKFETLLEAQAYLKEAIETKAK